MHPIGKVVGPQVVLMRERFSAWNATAEGPLGMTAIVAGNVERGALDRQGTMWLALGAPGGGGGMQHKLACGNLRNAEPGRLWQHSMNRKDFGCHPS